MLGDEEQRQRGRLGALDVRQDGVDTWSSASSASSAGGTEAADLRTLSTSSFGNIAVEGSSGVLIGGTTHLHQAITLVVPADTPPPPPPAVAVRDPQLPDLLPHAARGRQKHLPVDTQPDGSTACSRRPSCPASGLRSNGRRIRLAVCAALAVAILCFLLSLYLILPNCYEWVPYPDDGALPGCALAGGRGVSGEALFIARAYINNKYRDYVPGKVVPSAGGAWAACFTWNGREDCRNSSFQVLCADSRLGEWVDCAGGNVTDHAVYSGGASDSERLYVCRVRDRGAVTPGKLHPSKGGCYVALEGAEVRYPTYQVLDHCETLLCVLGKILKRSNYGRCQNAPRKQHS
ncbi:uncharacterized protein LOC113216509 [Frankliniella occidentalis]|uniref:Uncharacterized protein LOC113216509 n=1 Tax=Frankliniella occidentalis TaxID=133901 RepID=A0A9C6U1J2_FRAOC|nr:uncharacterized protein LOC113216509 [Frankliniella occidentalis]